MKKKPRSTPPHEHPEFVSVSTTIQYNRDTKVVWTAKKHPKRTDKDNTAYEVTIDRGDAGPLPFSLFTLAIQAIDFPVLVKNPSASKKIALIKPDATKIEVDAKGVKVPATGKASGDVKPGGIWFINFSGRSCELQVEAMGRIKRGKTVWSAPHARTGHSNVPPGGTTEK